jgi:hypothetical protein
MSGLFKRICIATIIEAGVLVIILYSIPAEVASNLILGRSIYRWALILPALILAGLIYLTILMPSDKTDLIIEKLRAYIAPPKGIFLDYLVFHNLTYLCLLFTSVLFLKAQDTSTFVRLSPWLIFATVVLLQIDYFLYRLARETGFKLDFKRSVNNIPATFWNIFLKNQGTYLNENRRTIFWLRVICTITLLSTFLVVGYYTITFAQLNSDEGWYLYAAKQVYQGQRLYQDFAYSQMPLLPYVYGLGLLLWKSMYAGRLISFLIFCASLILIYQISKENFKQESFLWLLFIFIVYPDGFYFNTIVKTYALTFFFFLLSFYIWISNGKAEIKYPILFLILLLGIFTRLTFAMYAMVLGIVAALEIWKQKNRASVYLITFVSCLPFLLWGVSFLYPDPSLPIWNIYGYNAMVHGMGFSSDALTNFFPHLRGFLRYARPFRFIGVSLILSVLASAYYGSLTQNKKSHLLLAAIACLSFLSLHFFSEDPLLEYYVPAIMFLVVLSVWFLFSFTTIRSGINAVIFWVSRGILGFIVIALMTKAQFGIANYNLYEGNPPIKTVQEVGRVINQYYPGQPIFALEGLYTAVETNRDVFPGLSMGIGSVLDITTNLDISTKEANRVHWVNLEIVADLLRSPHTKVVVLTDREIDALDKSISGFDNILETNYMNVFEIGHFGQKSVKAYVFIRK